MTQRVAAMSFRLLLAAILAVPVPGCGEPHGDEGARRATDSESPAGPASTAPRWELDPLWTSSDTLLLSGVFLVAADSRNRLYAYDRDLGLVLFSPESAAIRKLGRKGEGPGEYQWASHLQVIAGDTILVWDPRLGRLSAFEPDSGRFVRDRSFGRGSQGNRLAYAPPRWIHRVSGEPERYLAGNAPLVPPGEKAPDRRWVVRLLDSDGDIVRDSVLVFPTGASITIERERGFTVIEHPFGSEGIVRIGPEDRVHYAHTDTTRIRIFDLEGSEVGGFNVPRERFPVTDEDIEEAIERWANFDDFADVADELVDGIRKKAPERHPLFHDFLVDDRGRVWIPQPTHASSPGRPFEWEVFSPEGRPLGVLPVERGSLLAVRGDRAYGVTHDSLGVPTMWAAAIRKRAESPEEGEVPP